MRTTEETSTHYKKLAKAVLKRENVTRIDGGKSEKGEYFFDTIELSDGALKVYRHGLSKPFSEFLFDFDCDYARLLSYLEEDLFHVTRGGKPVHFREYVLGDGLAVGKDVKPQPNNIALHFRRLAEEGRKTDLEAASAIAGLIVKQCNNSASRGFDGINVSINATIDGWCGRHAGSWKRDHDLIRCEVISRLRNEGLTVVSGPSRGMDVTWGTGGDLDIECVNVI